MSKNMMMLIVAIVMIEIKNFSLNNFGNNKTFPQVVCTISTPISRPAAL